MPKRIDTSCPRCGPQLLEAVVVEVLVDRTTGEASYAFHCDQCGLPARGQLHEAIVPLLAQAGAQVMTLCRSPELPGGERVATPLTEAHVIEALALLEDVDPIVALLASDG